MRFPLVLFLIAGLAGFSSAARILGVLVMPSQSHRILLERLMRQLGEKGHEITYIAVTQASTPMPNMKVIYVENTREKMMENFANMTGKKEMNFIQNKPSIWMMPLFGSMMSSFLCTHIFEDPGVKKLLASDEKFDLIFGETMMNEGLLAGFSHRFKAPIVGLAPFLPNIFANYLVGNPAPASFIPDSFLSFGTKMTFFERVQNFLFGMFFEACYLLRILPSQDTIMRKYVDPDMPYIGDILKNTSLVLVNHHHSLAFPRPYVPNMIEVGGMHINEPKKLPKELQKLMDESKKGVVLFSLGSNVNSSDLSPETISSILKGLGRLEQDVLWKFELDLSPLPSNVKIMKWLPQSDILAHPNLKLFITHGGLLSTTEALQRAVPIVGIPIMGDQFVNLKQARDAGWALQIDLDDLGEETVYNAVTTIINNPSFKENAVKKSTLFKDTPMLPIDTAIWWIEYVLRHKGAPHLRSAAQDLAWHELYLLDVYALAAAILLPIVYINFLITRAIFRKIFGCKSCKTKTNKKPTKSKKDN